jgi:ankyrin repeat protein
VRGEHVATGLYLIPFLIDSVDSEGNSVYWYAAHSECSKFIEWEQSERRKTDCAYVAELIESRVSSFFLKLYIYTVNFFANENYFSDEYDAPLRCAFKHRRYDFLEWAVSYFFQECPYSRDSMPNNLLIFDTDDFDDYSAFISALLEMRSYFKNFIEVYLEDKKDDTSDDADKRLRDQRKEFVRLLMESASVGVLSAFINGDVSFLVYEYYHFNFDKKEDAGASRGNNYCSNPLMFAAKDGSIELFAWILTMLSDGSVDPLKLLKATAVTGRLDVVIYFVNETIRGGKLSSTLKQPLDGVMLLQAAVDACGHGRYGKPKDYLSSFRPEIVKFLTQKAAGIGQDVNEYIDTGSIDNTKFYDSVLARAVVNLFFRSDVESCWDLVTWLLDQKGVDINKKNDKIDPDDNGCNTLTRKLLSDIGFMSSDREGLSSVDMNYVAVLKHLLKRGLDVRQDGDWAVHKLCGNLIYHSSEESSALVNLMQIVRFFSEELGISLQKIPVNFKVPQIFKKVQDEQKERWRLAATLSQGLPLATIAAQIEADEQRDALFTAKYEKGRSLLHYAALNDRDDVIDWLVSAHGLDVGAVDGEGVSVFEMARRAGASKAMRAIATIRARVLIPDFCARRYRLCRARREWQGRRAAAVLIQKRVQLHQAYQLCGPFLRERRGSWQRFQGIWRGAIAAIEEAVVLGRHGVEASWTEAKADCDMYSTLRLDSSSSSPSSTGGGNSDDPLMQELMTKAAVADTDTAIGDDDSSNRAYYITHSRSC